MTTGKWCQPGVPRKGWTCESTEDLEDETTVCEMCEVTEIRYVHYMTHPDYPETLACGCVCAGHMEGELAQAERREKVIKNAAARRKRWLQRKWRVSAKGNAYLNIDGFNITVFQRGDHWSARIKDVATRKEWPAKRRYPTEERAKLAAFDAMIFLTERLGTARERARAAQVW